jgi:hypothetical protein
MKDNRLKDDKSFTVPELCGELFEDPYPSSRTMFCCWRQDAVAVVGIVESPTGLVSAPTPLQPCGCCVVGYRANSIATRSPG